jgi:hypothetical protein
MANKAWLIGLLFAATVQAADKPMYRFVDANGVVHYTDQAPNKHVKPMKRDPLGQLSTSAPSKFNLALPSSPRYAVHFDTPTPGQVYRDVSTPIAVAVSVMPGLIKGFSLVLQLNGNTVSSPPLREIQTSLHNPGAGSHTVVAVLLNAKGQELARSAPLKIHIQPPSARN